MTTFAIDAVAFDLDGLMFNTEEIYIDVAEQMLAKRGFTLDMELLHRMMGRPARVAFPMMIEWYGLTDSVEALEDETRGLFERLLPSRLSPMPGLAALLELIDSREVPKAIATSSGRPYLERILSLAELATDFEFFLTAEDVVQGKPDPEIYHRAAGKFDIEPARLLVFEDSENGCKAAVDSGAVVVAVPGKHNSASRYDGAALVADGLGDPRIVNLIQSD